MNDTLVGRKVKLVSREYAGMVEGEVGTLSDVIPGMKGSDWFLFPEYWVVERENGQRVAGHTHRWKVLEEEHP